MYFISTNNKLNKKTIRQLIGNYLIYILYAFKL